MAIDFSKVKPGDRVPVQPADIQTKLFLERQHYFVGLSVEVIEVSEPIISFNPRTGADEKHLQVTVTNGKRTLDFGVRESEGYASPYFA